MRTGAFLFLSMLASSVVASTLSELAQSLQPRSFVKMPENASLKNLEFHGALMYWNDSGVWNSKKKRMQWIGSGGSCCTNGQYFMLIYEEMTDAWSISTAPFKGSGHAYDGNAIDPSTGMHFFGRYFDKSVHTWDGQNWGELPAMSWSATTPALSFFAGANGGKGALVFVGESPNIAYFDGASWNKIAGGSWGSYNNFSEYNPVHNVLWFGSGNGGDRISYKLDASQKLTRLKDAPVSLRHADALHSCDPVSGMYIVTDLGNNTWWEFDIISDKWTQLTGLTNAPKLDQSEMQVPIPEYGVILYVRHYESSRDVYLYRHAEGVAPIRQVRRSKEAGRTWTSRKLNSAYSLDGRKLGPVRTGVRATSPRLVVVPTEGGKAQIVNSLSGVSDLVITR